MKNLKLSIAAMLLFAVSFTNAQQDHGKMKMYEKMQSSKAEVILKDYFNLKNALVADNTKDASKAGAKLAMSLKAFNMKSFTSEQQKELTDIIEDATEQAEHIAKSDMGHQREHFKTLSKDVTDMIAITGTKNTLYEQYCPMYDGGSAWLSMSKNVKNPYYGSKMLTCGKVQKEIN